MVAVECQKVFGTRSAGSASQLNSRRSGLPAARRQDLGTGEAVRTTMLMHLKRFLCDDAVLWGEL